MIILSKYLKTVWNRNNNIEQLTKLKIEKSRKKLHLLGTNHKTKSSMNIYKVTQ